MPFQFADRYLVLPENLPVTKTNCVYVAWQYEPEVCLRVNACPTFGSTVCEVQYSGYR